jgi:oxaloacetate decarboxylase alpha subunit
MPTAAMLPVAERMDRIGFTSIDLLAQVQIDACVRFLKENPWERLRLVRERIRKTPLRAFMRAKGFNFNDVQPQDITDLWIERLVANGIRAIVAFDGLNDIDNLLPIVRQSRKAGAEAHACITYSLSPVHSNELYVSTARGLIESGMVDVVMLKDSGGLLTVDRIRELVPALKAVLGAVPLEVHSHCTTGLAPLVYLEAARLGADILDTSIAPLANGTAQPSIQSIARNIRLTGGSVDVDDTLIAEVSEHFHKVARKEGKPLGTVQEYDAQHYQHQLPGGMISNFRASLDEVGLGHRLPEVIEECIQIRKELGWPMGITPFAQMIGTQAFFHVVQGKRYATVPDVVKKYALGYFGRMLAPVEPDILDKIVENGSKSIPLELVEPEPIVPERRKKYPGVSDEERLIRQLYANEKIANDMFAAGPIETEYTYDMPFIDLIKSISKQSISRSVSFKSRDIDLDMEILEPNDTGCMGV